MTDSLRYPIGDFNRRPALDGAALQAPLSDIAWHSRHYLAHIARLRERRGR